MKSVVVYFSKFGNTQKVAETIAQVLATTGSVDVIPSDQLSASNLQGADLVVMGTPTHNMNLPKNVKPVLENLPRRILAGIHVAAFDTSYKMSWWLNHFTAVKRLDRKLRKLGGKRVVPPVIFHVMEREGPLYPGEIPRVRDWAHTILTGVGAQSAQDTFVKTAPSGEGSLG
jgi:flavodoxin